MEDQGTDTAFASALRAGIARRGLSLRTIRHRLRDRGYEISVASLSLWQSGTRAPGTAAAGDLVRELEDLLRLEDGALTDTLRPRIRVPQDRNETFAQLSVGDLGNLPDEEADRELVERSGAIVVSLDAAGQIRGTRNRTVWQARVDAAQCVTVFFGMEDSESRAPRVRGTLGCTLTDVLSDVDAGLVRATLRLDSPLPRGGFAPTERESYDRRHSDDERGTGFSLLAPRRQVEVALSIVFDPDCVPRRCTATVESAASSRSHRLALNGTTASHVEFDFGPGSISIDWEW